MGSIFEASIKPEEYFILSSGRVLKNLNELLNALKTMDDETFMFHANEQKNDFSSWIKGVFKDEELANSILNLSKEETARKIESRLFELNKDNRKTEKKPIARKLIKSYPFVKSTPKSFLQKNPSQQNLQAEKIEEILLKEKEIEKREEKIEEIEVRIEKELAELAAKKEARFFSKEFIQGLVIGVLLASIVSLGYFKFFA